MFEALIVAIANLVLTVLFLYKWVIIISSLLTWVQPDPNNQIVQMLYRLTEPAYSFVRRYIPTVFGGIDLAPLVLIFGIVFLEIFLGRFFSSMM